MTGDDKWVAIAIVARPHAMRGAVLLKALTRTPEELTEAPLKRVFLRHKGQIIRPLTVRQIAMHKGAPYVFFEEVTDRTGAEEIAGLELVIPEEERWELPEGQFYADDLAGLELLDDETGRTLGTVLRAEEGPAHDYLVFSPTGQPDRKVMLPKVPEFVREISLERRQVRAVLPDGLLDV